MPAALPLAPLPEQRPSLRQSLRSYADKLRQNDLSTLVRNADALTRLLEAPPPSQHHFRLEGLQFFMNAIERPPGEPQRLVLWAELGYVPYCVESREKREAVYTILQSVRHLKGVSFAVDTHQKIHVFSTFDLPHGFSYSRDFILLVDFFQKARPVLRLLGEYL